VFCLYYVKGWVDYWTKYGVHDRGYNECTEYELREIRSAKLSPHSIGEVLIDIAKLLEE